MKLAWHIECINPILIMFWCGFQHRLIDNIDKGTFLSSTPDIGVVKLLKLKLQMMVRE